MKNGIVLEMDVCDLDVKSGVYECRFRKNVYKDDVFVKFLGYERGTVPPVFDRKDEQLKGKSDSEKDAIIKSQQDNIDNMLAMVAQIQAEQESALKAEETMFVEQKALRQNLLKA